MVQTRAATAAANPANPAPPPAAPARPPRPRRPAIQKPNVNTARASTHAFLSALYFEIDATLINDQNAATYGAIDDFIRRARLARLLNNRPPAARQGHLRRAAAVRLLDESNRPSFNTLARDLKSVTGTEMNRLGELFAALHAPVICACACSKIFRDLIRAADIPGKLSWNDMRRLLVANVHSIELFAATRDLDWRQQFNNHNGHYGRLLAENDAFWQALNRPSQPTGTFTAANVGIPVAESTTRHPNVPQGSQDPHLWYMPNPTGPANRCNITYLVTSNLLKYSTPTSATGIRVGRPNQNVPQESIADSVMLADYPWKFTNEWPGNNNDPRYAVNDTDPCVRCGKSQELLERVTANKPQATPRTCDCTYAEYQAELGYRETPLLELVDTLRTGKGVRALQSIDEKQFLGLYVGEMYPKSRVDNKAPIKRRYGGPVGEGYAFGADIAPRDDNGLRPTEHKDFYIDPAVRGNWTRFLNHSCDPNAAFRDLNLGQRKLILVEARRPIAFGDFVTVKYGNAYFRDNAAFACACQMGSCVQWNMAWNGRVRDPNHPRTGWLDAPNGNPITQPANLGATLRNNAADPNLPSWATVPGFMPTPPWVRPVGAGLPRRAAGRKRKRGSTSPPKKRRKRR